MKIFLAGPMHTRSSFEDEKAYLRRFYPDAEFLDPFEWGDAKVYWSGLVEDLQVIVKATHVFLVPGWRRSPGVIAEVAFILAANGNDGIEIDFIETEDDIPRTVYPDIGVTLH